MRKKVISALLVGILGFCNGFPALAMEKQESRVVSNETPIEMEQEKQVWEETVTPEMPCDRGNFGVEEQEVVGAGHSFGAATNVALNREVVDSLIEDKANYYAFTLPQNGKINIDFSHEIFESGYSCWEIILCDSDHYRIGSFEATDGYTESCTSWNYGLSAGNYYLKIERNEAYTNRDYSFRINYQMADNWETEFNDSWLKADSIQLNKTYYGTSATDSDSNRYYDGREDYYTFTLPNAGSININFAHQLFDTTYSCWEITLYNSNHTKIHSFESTDGYTESCTSWNYGLPAGNYYLVIDRNEAYSGIDYSFHINYQMADNWEKEFNDSWLTADSIQLNKTYYGTSIIDSDPNRYYDGHEDYYTFTLQTARNININFSHEIFESGYSCWEITLYNSNHGKIASFESTNGYKKSCTSQNYNLSSGTYYLIIDRNEGLTGRTYSFKINTKPALNETFQYGNGYYKVKKDGLTKEVQFIKMGNPNKTAFTVPSKVTYHGYTYNVTSVISDAFKNNKKIKSITLEKNITVLGHDVFYGCKNLKKITVKSTKLRKVGAKSLKGIYKKAVIKVPKSKLSKYKKLFKGKGQPKNVKVKKL